MRESSARRPRPRLLDSPRRGRDAALVTALLLVLGGCSSSRGEPAPEPAPTPIARLNAGALQLPRIDFCGLVRRSAVTDALGGKPDSDNSTGNGDREEVRGAGTDVVQEIGCSWSTDDGTTARAWAFARPADVALARSVLAQARRTPGCHVEPGAAYGSPSVTQVCTLDGSTGRVRHAGLFGQTWLSCEVTSPTSATPRSRLRSRADAWCVEVANALNTAR